MAVSGQVTIVTPGVAVQALDSPTATRFLLKAHPGNGTGLVLVSDYSSSSGSTGGFALAKGESVETRRMNLSGLYFNADQPNMKLTWMVME